MTGAFLYRQAKDASESGGNKTWCELDVFLPEKLGFGPLIRTFSGMWNCLITCALCDFDPNLCGSYFYSLWIRDKPFGINVRIAFNFGK
ncbi:hypothetical protein [Actinotignum schaalii]|uniref:Uncharacterized protein n=1 Tax=Actinotignum schaalii FB123-CNA-2 TaxID=883067 RepID=S2VLW8_9ACTO|nr:hypothetical protein [Actinotignum schaalii]EPD27776.1 hypothetical protein HMPREF9237_00333 [Actinotignum schaalii FB123-CNA-2]